MLRNVLIFHAGALGDFVRSWPLGLALGRLYPQSRIIFITHRQKGQLAERALRLESMDIEAGWHHLFGDPAQLPDPCRKKLQAAHSIFTYLSKAGDAWMSAVAAIAPQANLVSVNESLLGSLSSVPVVRAAVSQILASIAASGIRYPRKTYAAPVAVHPGSGSPAKCWPLDSYLSLIEMLQAAGHPCRILLGEVERERWPAEHIHRLESAAQTVQPATYVDLLQELCQCRAFVGNDSGPGQLAGILGLPSVILFGPTDPAVWKPLGPSVTIIRGQPMSSVSPEQIVQTVLRESPTALCSAQTD
ncbi:MAG: glycosyltransferase family 9 protein, partial [Tepidisphaeraceae bacterium]|jgi:ADP-heptose:LPS heptosyltransferase